MPLDRSQVQQKLGRARYNHSTRPFCFTHPETCDTNRIAIKSIPRRPLPQLISDPGQSSYYPTPSSSK